MEKDAPKGKLAKVIFVYKDFDDDAQVESVWAERTKDGHYKIMNVPFFVPNIAYGDIVSVENDEGDLYFDELITPSGHSTVQMIIYYPEDVSKIGEELVNLGCDWEGSHLKEYISVDIPPMVSYAPVKEYLQKGFLQKRWDYKEACLTHR